MIRRIGTAAAGLCAILLPACMTSPFRPSEPYWVDTNTGQIITQPRQTASSRLPGTNVTPGQSPYGRVPNPRIADGQLPVIQTGGTGLVDAKSADAPVPPADLPKDLEKPKDDPFKSLDLPKLGQPAKVPANNDTVIRPQWPNLGGPIPIETTSSAKPLENLVLDPPAEKLQLPPLQPAPNPERLPPQEAPRPLQPLPTPRPLPQASALVVPSQPAVQTPASPTETVLVKALRSFQNNRPDDAVEMLRQLDPTNQDVLLYLMPLMVRLGDGNAQNLPPDELAALVDRLQQATAMLKAKASLRLERVCFCRAVRKYGNVDTFDPRYEFRPGDMVHLYLEIRNFSCEPVTTKPTGAVSTEAAQRNYLISLATRLEIVDPQGRPVCNYDLQKDDYAYTPPQEYYHTYRFNVPENLTPGNYTLWVTVSDKNKPNSPGVRQPVELRVGRN